MNRRALLSAFLAAPVGVRLGVRVKRKPLLVEAVTHWMTPTPIKWITRRFGIRCFPHPVGCSCSEVNPFQGSVESWPADYPNGNPSRIKAEAPRG